MDTLKNNTHVPLKEALFLLIEEPDKYSYKIDVDNWVIIYKIDNPEKTLYLNHVNDFVYELFDEFGIKKPL